MVYLKKMLKMNRKAVSPVLATLLLIAIAVGAGVITYAWVMGFVGTQTATSGVVLTVDVAIADDSDGQLKITVRNTGTARATMDVCYVGLYPGIYEYSTSTMTFSGEFTTAGDLDPGKVGTVTIDETDLGITFTAGDTYYFKLVCTNGYAVEQSVTATT